MARKTNNTQRSSSLISKLRFPHWLTLLIGIQLILRIPSFFEPFSYGDEMIYLTLGEGIRQGLVLYKDIHDNKPPLLYFLAAIAGNVFWLRAILAAWMSFTTIIFWKLTTALFPKHENIQKIATIVFSLLTTLPLLEGNIANAEVFMVGPILLGFYLLLTRKTNFKVVLLAGICFSIAALFKIPAVFDMPAIIIFWLINKHRSKEPMGDIIKRTIVLAIGFSIPILISFAWYFGRGALPEYFVAAFAQNVGYLSSWRPDDVQKSFLVRNGPLLLRATIVLVGLALLYLSRKKISSGFLFATILLLCSLFAVTLSERPYPHYLIQAVPAFSVLVGILIASPRYEQVFSLIPLLLVVIIPVYYKYYYYPTASYYMRFLQFASGQINRQEYFNKFDGGVLRNYTIVNYLLTSTAANQKIFVWGDSSSIYALSRRLPPLKYVASYHIKDFSSISEVEKTLSVALPAVVIILPNDDDLMPIRQLLLQKYILVGRLEGAAIWRIKKS